MPIADCDCDYCHEQLSDWDYRYKGKHYCKKCYNYLFHFKICSVCSKKRKIYYALKIPICKFCQVKDQPCIRCGKEQYVFGKIIEHDAVCNSCAKYFLEPKKCTSCEENKMNVAYRTLSNGDKTLLCETCYTKTLPICSACKYRRKAYTFSLDKKPICKICSIEGTRPCKQCGEVFPAGYGNICNSCTSKKTLLRKTNFIGASLSKYMSEIFIAFSNWLAARRGVIFTANHISSYHAYFFQLDNICNELQRLSDYKELVARVSIATTRANLLVTVFLDEKKFIVIDKTVKEEYSNLDMIERYLTSFKEGTCRHRLILKYYNSLDEKLKVGTTTIRSIRLSLTPAVKFLQYCENFNTEKPSLEILKSYLWYYPGQRASITGFINFLSKTFKYNFSVKDVEHSILQSPNTSKAQLKQRMIDILRSDKDIKQRYLFKTVMGYLHGVDIPEHITIDLKDIKKDANKDYYIRIAGDTFYLPEQIVHLLLMQEV